MWGAYLKVIAKKAGQAIHVLHRFHIIAHMNKAIDKVRAEEFKELKGKGLEPVLTKTRWLLLKRPENLSEKQETKLAPSALQPEAGQKLPFGRGILNLLVV